MDEAAKRCRDHIVGAITQDTYRREDLVQDADARRFAVEFADAVIERVEFLGLSHDDAYKITTAAEASAYLQRINKPYVELLESLDAVTDLKAELDELDR
ncbi:MAG: hypothetical protein AAFV43_11775 [Planctomycetota bacterium]